jgi:hypothetical protein
MYLARMMAVAPALDRVSTGPANIDRQTYKIPKLIAKPAPIFSAVRICSFHRICHGNKASDISIMADHTAHTISMTILTHSPKESALTSLEPPIYH